MARCSPPGDRCGARATWRTRASPTAGHRRGGASEQLGGILGVPLVVGDDTLGVLLAAERRSRAFVDHDVELLAGLAAHAALALRTADLFDRERAARRGAAGRQRDPAGGEREPPAGERPARRPQRGRHPGRWTRPPSSTRSAARPGWPSRSATTTAARWRASRPPGGLVVPVDLPERARGDLVAAPDRRADEETLRLLRIGATTVAVLLASERSVAEAELRTRGEFVHALLSSDADEASLVRRARAIGIDLHAVTPVAVVDAEPAGCGGAAFAARLGADLRGWSAAHAGQVVVLVPRRWRRPARRSRGCGPDGATPTTGLAACDRRTGQRAAAYEEARQTAALLIALDRAGTCAVSEELGLYRSLFSRSGPGRAGDLRRAPRSDPCSTTTASASATSRRPWRPTSSRPGTTPAPARRCTSTPTRSTSASTASRRCSARSGRSPGAPSSCRWPCACTG